MILISGLLIVVLAGAGGAGDEDDPVGLADQLLPGLVGRRIHAQLFQAEARAGRVQQAQHGVLAGQRGNDRNAHVVLAAFEPQLDPTILGQPFLGDVQVGHDLDPADDRGRETLGAGWGLLLFQHAVDAVANAQPLVERLDVHVAGPLANCLDQDLVDELDQSAVLGQLQVLPGARQFVELEHVAALGEHLIDRAGAEAELGPRQLLDRCGGGDHRPDVTVDDQPQLVEYRQVERVGRGNDDRAVFSSQGQEAATCKHAWRHQRDDRRIDLLVGQIHHWQAGQLCQGGQHHLFADDPRADQLLTEAGGLIHLAVCLGQLLDGQMAALQEFFAQWHRQLARASSARREKRAPLPASASAAPSALHAASRAWCGRPCAACAGARPSA